MIKNRSNDDETQEQEKIEPKKANKFRQNQANRDQVQLILLDLYIWQRMQTGLFQVGKLKSHDQNIVRQAFWPHDQKIPTKHHYSSKNEPLKPLHL